jgi:hypothetical protein
MHEDLVVESDDGRRLIRHGHLTIHLEYGTLNRLNQVLMITNIWRGQRQHNISFHNRAEGDFIIADFANAVNSTHKNLQKTHRWIAVLPAGEYKLDPYDDLWGSLTDCRGRFQCTTRFSVAREME